MADEAVFEPDRERAWRLMSRQPLGVFVEVPGMPDWLIRVRAEGAQPEEAVMASAAPLPCSNYDDAVRQLSEQAAANFAVRVDYQLNALARAAGLPHYIGNTAVAAIIG